MARPISRNYSRRLAHSKPGSTGTLKAPGKIPRPTVTSDTASLPFPEFSDPLKLLSGPALERKLVDDIRNVNKTQTRSATELDFLKGVLKKQEETLGALVDKRIPGSCAGLIFRDLLPNQKQRVAKAMKAGHFEDGGDFPNREDLFQPGFEFVERQITGTALDTDKTRNDLFRRVVSLAKAADLEAVTQPDELEATMIDFGRRALASYMQRHEIPEARLGPTPARQSAATASGLPESNNLFTRARFPTNQPGAGLGDPETQFTVLQTPSGIEITNRETGEVISLDQTQQQAFAGIVLRLAADPNAALSKEDAVTLRGMGAAFVDLAPEELTAVLRRYHDIALGLF